MNKKNPFQRNEATINKFHFLLISLCLAFFLISTVSSASSNYEFKTVKNLSPSLIYTFDSPENCADFEIVGDLAYVSELAGTIWILDISDPTTPTELGSYDDSGSPHGICVQDGILYCASWESGLTLLDISDPSNSSSIGQYPGNNQACEVVVAGDIAYLASWEDGLVILNVSNPAQITNIGQICTTGYLISEVTLHEEIAMITDTETGDLLFINVTDPVNPTQLTYRYEGGIACDVKIKDDMAYIADWNEGVIVLDISNWNDVSVVTTIASLSAVAGLDIADDCLYVSDWEEGVFIYNISDILNPVEIGRYNIKTAGPIRVIGTHIFISEQDTGFIILDINGSNKFPTLIVILCAVGVSVVAGMVIWKFKKKP